MEGFLILAVIGVVGWHLYKDNKDMSNDASDIKLRMTDHKYAATRNVIKSEGKKIRQEIKKNRFR